MDHDLWLYLETRFDRLEGTVATQADLDAFATRVTTAVEGVRGDIQRWIDAHPELDTTGLESAVASLEALDAERPEPTPEPEV